MEFQIGVLSPPLSTPQTRIPDKGACISRAAWSNASRHACLFRIKDFGFDQESLSLISRSVNRRSLSAWIFLMRLIVSGA